MAHRDMLDDIRALLNVSCLGRLSIDFYLVIKGHIDIIVLYKYLLKDSSKAMIILLLTALYLGGQLAHGGHLHVNAHDLSVSECSLCSFSSVVVTNTYLDSFPIIIVAMVYAVPRYFAPIHHIGMLAHGTRAPPLTTY